MSPDKIVHEWIKSAFASASSYTRTSLPISERSLDEFRKNTRIIVSGLLRKILAESDSPNHDKPLNYKTFSLIQLELLQHILYCESRIQLLRKRYSESKRVELLKKRRASLKLLGSTVAWVLLEFDRAYIRIISASHDEGFMTGKIGLKAEVAALVSLSKGDSELTAVLHGITQCLRVGDLSVTDGHSRWPIEMKVFMGKKPRPPDRRERRQKKRGDLLFDYYRTNMTMDIIPGVPFIRKRATKRDLHNWDTLIDVAEEAFRSGLALGFAENAIAYGVCQEIEQIPELGTRLFAKWKKATILMGSFDHHIKGLKELMPFTLFEIPVELKEGVLFDDWIVLSLVDLKRVCSSFTKAGLTAKLKEDGIHYKLGGTNNVIGGGLFDRLRYECLSIQTFLTYALLPIKLSRQEKRLMRNLTPSSIGERRN